MKMTDPPHRVLGWLSLALLISPWFSGCNTVEGVGRDVESLGEAIEDEAEENQEDDDQ